MPPEIRNYFIKQPVTTSFDDAKTEVNLLENFNPPDDEFISLNSQQRTTDGKYIVTPGLYRIQAKSFCMHAGTHGPVANHGPGYLYADLMGPKADLIKEILQKWQLNAPRIAQHEVQVIIWAIIARVEVNEMNEQFQKDLKEILRDDFDKYNKGSAKEKLKKAGRVLSELHQQGLNTHIIKKGAKADRALGASETVQQEVVKVSSDLVAKAENSSIARWYKDIINAEYKLNEKYIKAATDFKILSGLAMLDGEAPSIFDIRKVSKGAWSYNPKGYFIRFMPSGYMNDRVDIYVPHKVQTKTDDKGRIDSVYLNGSIGIEFNYQKGTNSNHANQDQLVSIKVYFSKAKSTNLKLQKGFQYKYVSNSDVFDSASSTSDTAIREFKLNLTPSTSSIHFSKLQNKEKKEIYSLQTIAKAFNNYTVNNLEENKSINYIKNLLAEAGNNLIYQSIFSPASNTDNVILDLADNVATPANTAMQRLANADDSIPKDTSNLQLIYATTLDANSVSVTYSINKVAASSIHFDVYRSETPILNDLAAYTPSSYIELGQIDISDTNALKVGKHENITLLSNTSLLPDTRMPYVIVISTCNNKRDSVYFRKWMLGAIAHGFDRFAMVDPLNFKDKPQWMLAGQWILNFAFDNICHEVSIPTWESNMASELVTNDGYNDVIKFDWMNSCALPQPGLAEIAGGDLADKVWQWINQHQSHLGDVVDIHFIGHSRGTVVITQAVIKLQLFFNNSSKRFNGGYIQETLLDPHPANTNYKQPHGYGDWKDTTLDILECYSDESTKECVNKYIKMFLEVHGKDQNKEDQIISDALKCYKNYNAEVCGKGSEFACLAYPALLSKYSMLSTDDFQKNVQDPNILVPDGVKVADVWFQHTLVKYLCHQPNQEFIQNLWGYVGNNTLHNLDVSIQKKEMDLTNVEIAGIGAIGHNEVPLVYEQLVVKPGTLNRTQ